MTTGADPEQQRLDRLTEEVRRRMEGLEPIRGTVILELGEQAIIIDGRGDAHRVTQGETGAEADCRIRLAPALMESILAGERSGFAAFMSGQIAARGDMSVAIRLRALLT